MRKNLKTDEPEPKNANHGQNEQHREEGQDGKGTGGHKTRSDKAEGTKASKSED